MAASRVVRLEMVLGALALLLLALPDSTEGASPLPQAPANGKIAYVTDSEMRVMNPDGSNVSTVSNTTTECSPIGAPYWSPDGSRIAFIGHMDCGASEQIYLMNEDGSGLTNLTAV